MKAAKRPAPRTITITVPDGDFEGWTATARADFPARVLADLESGKMDRLLAALDAIIVSHNFPDSGDGIAATMADVDPYPGLLAVAGLIFDGLGKLPSR
jgi:hypothetical protein